MPNSIYISGPMTGLPRLNRPAFVVASVHLRSVYPGVQVKSPHAIVIPNPTWENYMCKALEMMLQCEGIYMLKGWRNSKGARLEMTIAQELGMEIIYEC